MRLLLMCGSELSEGVEVLEEDRGEPGGGKRREDVVMQIRNFCILQMWVKVLKQTCVTFLSFQDRCEAAALRHSQQNFETQACIVRQLERTSP